MTDWFQDKSYIPPEKMNISEANGAWLLREGWKKVYGEYPSDKSLAVLWAKASLETGRFKAGFHNWNFGNIKKIHANLKYKIKDDGHFFTMFRCNEILNGKVCWFDPPHVQTHFRAYKTDIEGAEDYIRFVSKKTRYAKAWAAVKRGDPQAYAHELKVAKYYTANEATYTRGVVSLFNEFIRRKDELLSYEPPPPPEPPKPAEPKPLDADDIPIPYIPTEPKVKEKEEFKKTSIGLAVILALAAAFAWISSVFEGCF
jgi:hypothetical protein